MFDDQLDSLKEKKTAIREKRERKFISFWRILNIFA